MKTFSTRQAAAKLGIGAMTLSRYINNRKVPSPKSATSGGMTIHFWTEEEIEHVRKLLPKLANGRKTRYQKQKSEVGSQKPVKAKSKTKKQPQPGAAVPHKQSRKRK